MTSKELSLEFDRLYDDATLSSPGVNEYEKSVFLTMAQNKIIDKYIPLIEANTSVMEILSSLLKYKNIDANEGSETGALIKPSMDPFYKIDSYIFKKPSNIYKLLYGQLETDKDIVQVSPISYDVVAKTINNPFRANSNSRAWLVYGTKDDYIINPDTVVETATIIDDAVNYFEVLYGGDNTPTKYSIRYVSIPKPIITTDFESDPEISGMGLTIDGLNKVSESSLSSVAHDEIIRKAVELAVLAYRENTLQNQVGINKV